MSKLWTLYRKKMLAEHGFKQAYADFYRSNCEAGYAARQSGTPFIPHAPSEKTLRQEHRIVVWGKRLARVYWDLYAMDEVQIHSRINRISGSAIRAVHRAHERQVRQNSR